MGAPVDRPAQCRFPDDRGVLIRKRYPSSGGVFDPFPFQESAAPIWWLRRVERKPTLLRGPPITHEPEFGSRSSIRRGCWDWLRLWRG